MIAAILRKQIPFVMGVDMSPELIALAKRRVRNVEFMVGDVTELKLDKKFDLIVMTDTYQHIPAYRINALWEVINRYSSRNSILYFLIPSTESQFMIQGSKDAHPIEEIVLMTDVIAKARENKFKEQYFARRNDFVTIWFVKTQT